MRKTEDLAIGEMTIRVFLTPEGKQSYNLTVTGDLGGWQTIGILSACKHNLLQALLEEDRERD